MGSEFISISLMIRVFLFSISIISNANQTIKTEVQGTFLMIRWTVCANRERRIKIKKHAV